MRIFEITGPAPGERRILPHDLSELEAEWVAVNDQIKSASEQLWAMSHGPEAESTALQLARHNHLADLRLRSQQLRLEIANARTSQSHFPQMERVWTQIEQDCARHLELYQNLGLGLYRGIKTNVGVIHAHSPTNRRPRDSERAVTAAYDYALEAEGIQARRSNSIFTSSDPDFASEYGALYYVFPVDNRSTYSWSGTRDLVLDSTDIKGILDYDKIREYRINMSGVVSDMSLPIETRNAANHLLNLINDTHFFDRLYEDGPDQVPGLHMPWQSIVDTKRVMQVYQVQDDNLDDAILSGNEVLISGEYYAVSKFFYYDFVSKKLGWIQ